MGAKPTGFISERASASAPARTERGVGAPARERVGGSVGAKRPGPGDLWLSAILFAGFLAMFATALDYPPAARAVPMLVGASVRR